MACIIKLIITFTPPLQQPILPIPPKDEPWLLIYRETGNNSSIRFISDKQIPLSNQLAALYQLGFVPKDDMRESYERRLIEDGWTDFDYEYYPYWLALTALGWEEENDKGELFPYSDMIYCFDAWDSNEPENHFHTLSQIERLSSNEIPLSNIQSGRKRYTRRMWVSYELNGELFKWSVPRGRIYNPLIIDKICKFSMMDTYDKNLYWRHDEQGIHLVYTTREILNQLYNETGISFFGLDDNQIRL